MKFGKTAHPENIDFSLPDDHAGTRAALQRQGGRVLTQLHMGCAKWNKQDLRNFYPRGTKDELSYYSSQFNCIELNATFYRIFPATVFAGWRDKTPDNFVFYPKLPQIISHWQRLQGVERHVDEFLRNAAHLGDKLGTSFLQMAEDFGPHKGRNRDNLIQFVRDWPKACSLAIELRHADWFSNQEISTELHQLFEEHGVTNIITDVAARRDLLHMRLTSANAFVRYVGANHASDYTRLDAWVDRIAAWSDQGAEKIGFFVHQNHELESPLLARYFIEKINERTGARLKVPSVLRTQQESLF